MEENALFDYQIYPASHITGEGRTEILRVWGPGTGLKRRGDRGGVDSACCAHLYV